MGDLLRGAQHRHGDFGDGTTTPAYTPQYVGPGASGVDSVVLAISNPYTPAGGTTIATASVYANNAVVPGVPVGFISSDPTKVPTPVNNGLSQAVVLAPPTGDDSVVITAVTPVLPAVSDTATFHYVPVAARIIAVSGDAQSGLIGTAFGLPLIVEVQDAGGAPYRGGYPVTFGVASGPTGTSVAPTTVNTDLTGRAQTVLTAGSAVGALSVTATATGLTGSPLTSTARRNWWSRLPTTVAVAGGNNQSDSLSHLLPNPLVVLVSDRASAIPFRASPFRGPRATGVSRHRPPTPMPAAKPRSTGPWAPPRPIRPLPRPYLASRRSSSTRRRCSRASGSDLPGGRSPASGSGLPRR